jgi:hypothetical protein
MLSKLKMIGLALAGFFVALGLAFSKGRQAGVEHMKAEQQGKRDALQNHYDQIDAGPVDVQSSYDRLRDRSKGNR